MKEKTTVVPSFFFLDMLSHHHHHHRHPVRNSAFCVIVRYNFCFWRESTKCFERDPVKTPAMNGNGIKMLSMNWWTLWEKIMSWRKNHDDLAYFMFFALFGCCSFIQVSMGSQILVLKFDFEWAWKIRFLHSYQADQSSSITFIANICREKKRENWFFIFVPFIMSLMFQS